MCEIVYLCGGGQGKYVRVCLSMCVCLLSKKSRKDYPPIRGRPFEHNRWETLRDILLLPKWPNYHLPRSQQRPPEGLTQGPEPDDTD